MNVTATARRNVDAVCIYSLVFSLGEIPFCYHCNSSIVQRFYQISNCFLLAAPAPYIQFVSTFLQSTSIMTITYRNGVSIAEICVYVPALAVAVFLSIKHGFARSSGWFFLIVFCVARLIGPAMQLAEIGSPDDAALYEGSAILNNVGFSPLTLAALGLLSRLLDSINKTHNTLVKPGMLRLIELLVVVGLVLGIVGGVDAASAYETTLKYTPGSLNKAGTSLMIVCSKDP